MATPVDSLRNDFEKMTLDSRDFGMMELGSSDHFNFQAFYEFINVVKPTYKGINAKGEQVTVKLLEWHSQYDFGSGEVHPYTVSSMYEASENHKANFDFYNSRVIAFTSDDYSESVQLALRVSDDYKTLSILDWSNWGFPKKILGELKLEMEIESV